MRAGKYRPTATGYSAFSPAPFPPHDLVLDPQLLQLLSKADQALGRLDGSSSILPSPDLFVRMYVRREAVLSSQIEGTQASLMELLESEALRDRAHRGPDVQEVSNYIAALKYGIERSRTLPLSLRFLREMHARLLRGVRGGETSKSPGEFRRSQNWVGGASPGGALYVPPRADEMHAALDEFERFLHDRERFPLLVQIGLAHAQFETIHPFADGNGRTGRLLISFMLAHGGVLTSPLLYLSLYLKRHRRVYYDRLQSIRDDGAWEPWLAFFLTGVAEVADEATETARKILATRDALRITIQEQLGGRSANGLRLLDHLFEHPLVEVKGVMDALRITQPAANALVGAMAGAGIIQETTGRKRSRVFELGSYLALFKERARKS